LLNGFNDKKQEAFIDDDW